MKKTLHLALFVILLWTLWPGNASSALVVDSAAITPGAAPVGVATTVTVTAVITEPSVLPDGVNLQRYDSSGRVVGILGLLHDDGANGDATAGDKTFTLRLTFYETTLGPVTLRVSAAFRGSILRAMSSPLTLNITGSTPTGINILAPADLAYLNTSPVVVNGTVGDPGAAVTINGIPAAGGGGTFQASVPLIEGTNTLTAVARNTGGTTNTSSVQVTLDTTPPHLTIESPADNLVTTDASVTVAGTINDIVLGTVNNQQATVTVNGAAAQVANRSFVAAGIPLALGPNTIQAIGRDRSGNSVTTSVQVTRAAPTVPFIKVFSGNNQSAAVSTTLSNALVVALDNGSGQPIANAPVVFKVTDNNGIVTGGGSSAPSTVVNSDAQGRAQVTLKLGSRAGAGSNRVEATAPGFTGTAAFVATGVPAGAALITVDSGNNQVGALKEKLAFPFVTVVTDAGFNRLGSVPVTFTVKKGGGTIAGKSALTMNTDPDGRAAAVLTLGTEPGLDNNVVEVTFTGNTAGPAVFVASAKAPGRAEDTSISGVVLDNSNKPIQDVTVRLFQTNQGNNNNTPQQIGTPVKTDAQGQFVIASAPVGFFKLMADGTTVLPSRGVFPTLEYDIVTVAGQDNTVGMPLLLPLLDVVNKLCVTETTGGTLTLPEVPGFSLTVAPGSATFPGGARSGCVSVSTVNADKSPMSPGFGQQPRFLITIQPVGTTFNPPAPITMPNVDGLQPGQVTELYSYDHDLSAFTAIGTGTVSEDGLLVRSDPGVGILKAGWHCGGNPNSSGSAENVTVTLSTKKIVLPVGRTANITATGAPTPIGTPAYSWSSGAAATATVAPTAGTQAHPNTALVTGVAPGTTTGSVTYQCKSGANATETFDISVVDLKFQQSAACSGFDATTTDPSLMVPKGGSNTAQAVVNPATAASNVKLVSAATGTATVAPATLSSSPETVTVTGVAKGATQVTGRPASGPDAVLATLNVDVKDKITKKVAIHAITEENDDTQATAVGRGLAGQVCVGPGANGALDSTRGGDDIVSGTSINTGADGICNSTAAGDDAQVVGVGKGLANSACVGAGANAFRDTATPSGDDAIAGTAINSGANGICETAANATNLVPTNAASAAALQTYLNDIWGKQANVFFTVTRSDFTVNYDLNRDGGLADSPLSEVNAISAVAKDATVDFNIYYVKNLEVPQATTVIGLGLTWIQDSHVNSTVNVSAHEMGHLLGISYESSDAIDVMLSFGSATNPCNVKRKDWNIVNP